jgi:hypothetical protein
MPVCTGWPSRWAASISAVVGDRRVAVVDEEASGGLESHGAGRDDQVTELDALLEDAARADADESGMRRDGQDLRQGDLHVVGADAGRDGRDAPSLEAPGDRGELPVALPHLDVGQPLGDAVDAVRVAREEDVLGQLAGSERDVVLAFAFGKRDAGVRVVQAWVRPAPRLVAVRQG